LFFQKKKKKQQVTNKTKKMIALWNPAGSDPTIMLEKLLAEMKKQEETVVVVELPCLGIPHVAYRFGVSELENEHTIDQLLIDYDRNMIKGIHSYLHHYDGFDGILVQPKSKPDSPTLIKIQQSTTLLDIANYLKANLLGYDNIFVVLQGQLIHPMTFFALREADEVVLGINEPIEIIRAYAAYRTLKQDYSLKSISLFSEVRNSDFTEAKIYNRAQELYDAWKEE
jgi:hypothetical protein